jgi:hypothetical protein
MTTPDLLPVLFKAPLVAPAGSYGLYPVTAWAEDDGPERWLASCVEFYPMNYSGASQFGVWDQPWCGDPDAIKSGDRPTDVFLDAFEPMTVWAWDHEFCQNALAVNDESRANVLARVAQVLRLQEPTAVESAFATRVLTDAGSPGTAADIVGAVAFLELALADANIVGFIHASPVWLASLAQARLLIRTPDGFTSPMGHRLVFGGGYGSVLGDTLVATRPTFGWRGEVRIHDHLTPEMDRYVALAERDVVVGYEGAIAAVTVTS